MTELSQGPDRCGSGDHYMRGVRLALRRILFEHAGMEWFEEISARLLIACRAPRGLAQGSPQGK